MSSKRPFTLFAFVLFLLITASCRRGDATPTPTPAESEPPTTTTRPATAEPAPATATSIPLTLADPSLPAVPQVIGQSPAANEETGLDGYFEVYFDQPMDEAATAAAWQIIGPDGEPIEGEISWPQPRVLRFKPNRSLRPDSSYQATLEETAASEDGEPLLEGLSFTFYTIGDLEISQVSPLPDAAEVSPDSAITIIFNRPVVPLLIAEAQTDLPDPLIINPPTEGQGEWVNTSVYVFRPDEPLIGRQQYNLQVNTTAINEASTTGATMTAGYQWSFTVAAPTIAYLNLPGLTSYPNDNFQNLPLDQSFQLFFAQPMDPESTQSAVFLSQGEEGIPLDFTWNELFTTLTFTPTQLLEPGQRYTLDVTDAARSSYGGQLNEPFTWTGNAVPPPAVVRTEPANGRTQDFFSSVFSIEFAAPMDADSLAGKVIISPAPAGDPDGQYDFWSQSLRFYGLQASTEYTVQILPGMADPYGNTIAEGQTLSFTTAPREPSAAFNFPSSIALYRTGGSDLAWISSRNVQQLEVSLYQITLEELGRLATGTIGPWDYQPPAANRLWLEEINITAAANALDYEPVELVAANGQPLEPGYYFLTLDSPQVPHETRHLQGQALIVASANLTLKTTTSEALIWLTDLTSGRPLADVPVVLYDDRFNPIFDGTTDENGLLYQDGLTLKESYGTYYAMTDDPAVLGVAFSNWSEGVQPFDFGVYGDYYSPRLQDTVYVYTDRPMYRPGQTVSFKGIGRINDDLAYTLPDYETVHVTVASYAETIFDEELPLSDFGSFTAQLTLDDEAELGGYSITIMDGQNYIGGGYFSVAEYRKPTFQVTVTADEQEVLAGSNPIEVTAAAQFFSGGSVVNGQVNWYVQSTAYSFSPGGDLSGYSFNNFERDLYYYDGFGYNPAEIIAEGSDQTDATGRYAFTIPAELNDAQGSRIFTIETGVTDVAGNQVNGRTTVIVHRSTLYPGIRPEQYVGTAGDPVSFDVVVADWAGELVSEQSVSLAIVERRWYSVQEENEAGETVWRTSVEEIPVESFDDLATDEDGHLIVSFEPPQGGVYRAIVTTRDEQGNEATASTYVWVAGEEYVSWRRVNDHSFELIANATNYRPGDTAELLIASPFQGDAYALLTVERGHIRSQEVLHLTGNSTLYHLPITGDMAPNIFVSVMVVKGVDETNPAPDFKVGYVQFTVEREEQQLSVEVIPDRETAGPGDTVNYTVRVSDFQGEPVDAEVSLALADLAALTITGPNSSPILDFFYSTRWLGVETALLLTYNMDAFNQELQDQIKGGGGGGDDSGVPTVRENFPDTAYWEGQLQTGPDGEATVAVTLPDNLTTWRMDARAVTLDTRVGETTADIITTRPLLVLPQTPRFFVVGDQAQIGTAVHNNTDDELEATVTLQAEGVSLDSPETQQVTIPAHQQAYVSWDITVSDVSRVDFVFTANSGDFADASRPTLGTLDGQGIPVYRYETPETVGTAGQLLEGGAIVESIGLPIFPDFEISQGQVTIELQPSLAAAMTNGLDYLEHYPYECTEQIVSRFLPNVLTSRAMQAAGLDDPSLEANLENQVNIALQRLYSRQRADGGWPWWDGERTDTLVTAYVVWGLLEAKESGYTVSQGVIDQGVNYLQLNWDTADNLDGRVQANRQAFITFVLARAGKQPSSEIEQLYEDRAVLDLYGQALLTQAIYLVDEEDPRLDTLASDFFSSAILSATGANWEEKEQDDWNWNSDLRTTAIILDTLVKLDPDNPIVANAVRWLMAHRTDGRWPSTQETAWSLIALTDFMVASGELEADYEYEVALNGELLGSGEANADTLRNNWQTQLDVTELLQDELNRLAIGRSDGPGNLYYTTHLQVYLPVEQIPALDRGIILSRSYFDPNDRETPITEIEQGETFLARLTIVVPDTLHYVLIEDFLPAGLEAIDTSLLTNQQIGAPELYQPALTWEDYWRQGWNWWFFQHVELRDEKVVLSADYLPAGTYEYVYLVRATTPGEYRTIPPTASEFYFPEVYGRGEGSLFVVRPAE